MAFTIPRNTTASIRAGNLILFGDDPLVIDVTLIKAVHIQELRQAVDAVRAAASLSSGTYTDTLTAGVTIVRAVHVSELRTQLAAALTALGIGVPIYSDPTLTAGLTPVRASQIQELRNAIR